MIALLGPPPKELHEREKEGYTWKWVAAKQKPEGKLCTSVRDYYGGPFFDSEGQFSQSAISCISCCAVETLIPNAGEFIRKDLILAESVPSLEGEDKRRFLDFVRKMLQWLPEDRKTAKKLLEDPWLD